MNIESFDPEKTFAVYMDTEGNEISQPISDIPETGTLIDPYTDEDLDIVRIDVRTE